MSYAFPYAAGLSARVRASCSQRGRLLWWRVQPSAPFTHLECFQMTLKPSLYPHTGNATHLRSPVPGPSQISPRYGRASCPPSYPRIPNSRNLLQCLHYPAHSNNRCYRSDPGAHARTGAEHREPKAVFSKPQWYVCILVRKYSDPVAGGELRTLVRFTHRGLSSLSQQQPRILEESETLYSPQNLEVLIRSL